MSQVDDFFQAMHRRFSPEAAAGVDAVIQYQLAEGEQYFLEMREGHCALEQGLHQAPTVTLKLKFANLKKLASGELDGVKAVMFGKLKIMGDMQLATRLARFFPTKG